MEQGKTIADMKKDKLITNDRLREYLTSKGIFYKSTDSKDILLKKVAESVEQVKTVVPAKAVEPARSVKSSASASAAPQSARVGPAKNTRSQAAVDTGQSFMSKASDPAGTGLSGLLGRKRLVRFK